jgi:hypothetical protein
MKVISEPIKSILDSMGDISDAYGFRVLAGPFDAVVWVFPSDGRSLCYQPGQGWCQWSGKNLSPLKVTARAFDSVLSRDLVGTRDGYVGQLDIDTATDIDDEIPAHVTTGFTDRGTSKRKRCKCVRATFRRGQGGTTGPHALLTFRDDLGAWESPLTIDLGAVGDSSPVVEFRSLGVYRSRQWKFGFTGSESLSLVKMEEEFDELEM